MISIAYCYECHAIASASCAILNSRLHYFCSSPGCALPVFPKLLSRTGTAFFESQDLDPHSEHIQDCPHRKRHRQASVKPSNGRLSSSSADRLSRPVPTMLATAAASCHEWTGTLNRGQIATLMATALPGISGDMDEIAFASEAIWRVGKDAELCVGGERGTYETSMLALPQMHFPWRGQQWRRSIVVMRCSVVAGKRSGFWFLRVHPDGARQRISMMLRPEMLASSIRQERVLTTLQAAVRNSPSADALLFWQGDPPDVDTGDLVPTEPLDLCLALRLREEHATGPKRIELRAPI